MGSIGKLFVVGLLALCLPMATGAGDEPAAGSETAAPATAEAPKPDAAPATDTPPAEPRIEAYTGTIEKVMAEGLLVRRAGQPTDPAAPAIMLFKGRLGVPVQGQGKQSWMALRRGDVVLVSYAKGPPHHAKRVNVLPKPVNPLIAAAMGMDPTRKPKARSFVGYVKKRQATS